MLGNKVWLNLEDYEFFATSREDKEHYNNVSFFFIFSLAASGSDQLVWSAAHLIQRYVQRYSHLGKSVWSRVNTALIMQMSGN